MHPLSTGAEDRRHRSQALPRRLHHLKRRPKRLVMGIGAKLTDQSVEDLPVETRRKAVNLRMVARRATSQRIHLRVQLKCRGW